MERKWGGRERKREEKKNGQEGKAEGRGGQLRPTSNWFTLTALDWI